MRFLLDTNAVISVLKQPLDGPVSTRLRQYRPADIATSAVVISELTSGALRGAPERRTGNLDRVRSLRFEVLPFDAADAEAAGALDAMLKLEGRPIGPLDVLIAGQALARDMTVVTNNMREFSRVAGLRVVDWS
jgi:tRNA(fMet)-specific endonuclease VapC